MPTSPPCWTLLGAGNIGSLAALYLTRAGHGVGVLRSAGGRLEKRLTFTDGRAPQTLALPVWPSQTPQPISHLLVACKTPYTTDKLAGLTLTDDVCVIRLQNGLGSLDGQLPGNATVIEAVTTSAVRGAHPEHEIVAENQTWMGGPARRPAWFDALTEHWPGLEWTEAIGHRQYQKLVANAVINPLTALHDVANGAVVDDPTLREQAEKLAAEADTVLAALDGNWPGGSWPQVAAVARATAANTSSMRADIQRGAVTEIDAINGWLLRQAEALDLTLPTHAAIVTAIKAHHPVR